MSVSVCACHAHAGHAWAHRAGVRVYMCARAHFGTCGCAGVRAHGPREFVWACSCTRGHVWCVWCGCVCGRAQTSALVFGTPRDPVSLPSVGVPAPCWPALAGASTLPTPPACRAALAGTTPVSSFLPTGPRRAAWPGKRGPENEAAWGAGSGRGGARLPWPQSPRGLPVLISVSGPGKQACLKLRGAAARASGSRAWEQLGFAL